MRALAVLLAAATLGLCSALLVACGDDREGLIPPADAAAMNDALDRAEQELEAEECRRAQEAVADASERAADLPVTVDAELRAELNDGMAHVADRVRLECQRQQTTTTPTTPTVTETVPEPEPEPEPDPIPTTPEPEPTPTTPDSGPGSGGTPPGNGNGNGKGNGNGNGSGGSSAGDDG